MGKSYFSIAWKMPCKKTMDMGGAPPHTDNLIRSAAGGRRPNRTVEKTRRVRVLALSPPLQLSGAPELGALKRAQGWPGSRPAGLSLSTKPTIGGGLRPCQSRNGATKSTVAEESFPGDVTRQRSKPAEFPEQRRSWTRDARNKELNSRGKRNQRIEPALNPFKQVQTEFLILTELVKIWSECSNKTYVFVRDLLAGWLSYEIERILFFHPQLPSKLSYAYVCVCLCLLS